MFETPTINAIKRAIIALAEPPKEFLVNRDTFATLLDEINLSLAPVEPVTGNLRIIGIPIRVVGRPPCPDEPAWREARKTMIAAARVGGISDPRVVFIEPRDDYPTGGLRVLLAGWEEMFWSVERGFVVRSVGMFTAVDLAKDLGNSAMCEVRDGKIVGVSMISAGDGYTNLPIFTASVRLR